MTLPNNLRVGLSALVLVTVGGAVGFVILADIAFLDAIYMTVIVITTLGFGEPVVMLTAATKVWLIIVLVSGMGAALYTFTALMEYGFEIVIGSDYRRRRKMRRDIGHIDDHVIVCGFGRVGATAAAALRHDDVPVVVIERDADAVSEAVTAGYLVVEGDATRDEVLAEAQILSARSVVACVASSSDNLVITLSSKALRPDTAVYARARDAEFEKKLTLAGADAVVTPELVGGRRIAALATRSGLVEFLDTVVRDAATEFRIRRYVVPSNSPVIGHSLSDIDLRKEGGAMVIGIAAEGEPVQMNPDPHQPLTANNVLFGIGSTNQLSNLADLIEAP